MTYLYRRHRRSSVSLLLWFLPLLLLLLLLPKEKGNAVSAEGYNLETGPGANAEERNITLARSDGSTEILSLEDYIIGVTAAEMPSQFSEEARKAQAVIARTYALWKRENAEKCHENGVDLCDDPGHCQAYYDESMLRKRWGIAFEEKYSCVQSAVEDTAGQVLTYKGDLAETYYHSTCGGQTASAEEVWGEDVPYLQSVDCKWDEDAPRYEESFFISLSELPWLLGDGVSPCIAVTKGETISHVPAVAAETESGRILTVSYAGLLFDAADFRTALELNSTNFKFRAEGDTLTVITRGFGHGVGLCQYGANGMAEHGYTYDEILSHYYQKTKLENLKKVVDN